MKKITNFDHCDAKTPQNTGGGSSQFLTVEKAVWNTTSPTVSRRSTDGQSLRHPSVTHLSKAMKYAAMLLLTLTLGVGQMWGADDVKYLFYGANTGVEGTNLNTTDFFTASTASDDSGGKEIDGKSGFTKYIQLPNQGSSAANDPAKFIQYDFQSTSTTIDIYVVNTNTNSGDRTLYIKHKKESTGSFETDKSKAYAKGGSGKYSCSFSNTGNATAYIQVSDNKLRIYQIVVTEKGTALPKTGEIGYSIAFNTGKRAALKGGTVCRIDGFEIKASSNFTPASSTEVALAASNTNYIKFVLSEARKVTVRVNDTKKFFFANSVKSYGSETQYGGSTGPHDIELAAGTWYLQPVGASSANPKVQGISFGASSGGDDPGDTPANYAVTHSLSNNVVAKSGDTGASAATEGSAYNAVFGSSKVGYSLPSTIGVTIGGEAATVGTDYTWNSSTGAFQVPAAKVTGDIVITIAGVAPVKTFKSDYSDFTQVGETNAYYTYLAQEAYTSYAVAGWISYENENFASKKLKIDPATDEEISGSNANYGCLRSDRIMEFYLTGVSAVKFYVINGGSSGDPRVAKYTLNGGEETTLVSVAASTSNTGTIELDPSTNNTIRIYASSDLHMGAMKVTLPDASCAATIPGDISKGDLTDGSITLTAAGSAETGDVWYWQSSATGEDKTGTSGAKKTVNAAGTYYIRSYNTAGNCWSDAKSIELTAEDFLATPEVTFHDGAYVVGASALNLSTLFTSQNTSAVSFALKVASEDATVSGSNFTATKEGSYVIVATQVADANYTAVSEEATITVTYPATGEATISYVLDVTNNGTTLQTTKVDKNVSTISASASTTLLAGGLGTGGSNNGDKGTHKGGRTLGINVLPSEDADKYFYVAFSVAGGYEFTPSAISLKVLTIGGDDSHPVSYKAVLTDGVNSITGTATADSDAELTLGSWDGLGTTTLSGDVTLKLYAWYTTSDTYNAYRLSTPITIVGTVAEYVAPVDYTVTINPNGGAYASTPTGWTYDNVNGVYTKTVTGGTSFSAPEGLEKGTDELSWKDGSDNVVTFPTTISGDITFIAQWTPYVESSNADLSALSVAGCTLNETFAKGTTAYTTNLPFGSSMPAVSDVTATKDDTKAADPVVSISGNVITVHCVAENGTTEKDYTITVTIASSKDIRMVWKKEGNPCGESSVPADIILSTNDLVKDYLAISFVQTTETAANQAEEKSGSYLSTGKSVGNLVKITAKPGFAFKNMSFFGKIETSESQCPISIDGGETWTPISSTSSSNAQYCDIFTNAEVHEIILKNNAGYGTWLRHMDLTMIQACTPKTIAWTAEPAAEYELGSSPDAIAASANNGTVSYASTDGDVLAVNESTGALTLKTLGTVTLSASVPAGDGTLYCATPASVVKEEIKTYYLVTFDAQNETAATPVKYYSGDAAIALPNPSYSGYVFQGWFDAAEGGNKITGATITPTASRTVYAQWIAQCAGPTITTQPASANYFVGRTATALSCEATAGAAGELTYTWYSCDDAERTNPVALEGAPTPSTAAVGTFYYYCTVQEAGCDVVRTSNVAVITVMEKDMLRIIKIATTGGSNKTVTGYFAKAADCAVSLQSDSKFSSDSYMKMALDNEEFQAGDIFNVHITKVSENGYISLYSTNGSQDALLYNSGVRGVVGNNRIPLTDAIEGYSTLFLCRTSGNSWNAYVDFIEVYRPFPQPLLTGMTIDGAVAVVDELDATVYNVTIPAGSDLASLDVVPTFLSNDPSLTNGAVSGSWTIGSNTYVVTDKDGDSKSYTINITRDAAVESVSVSGETTVAAKSQITLTATVLPAEVSNKSVVWSSSDETKATVDANGVVTGKAAGSVTITATSVADNTKKGTKEITVTKFVGTERVYWFAYAADATANGVENNSAVFGSAPTGTTDGAKEITLEEGWVVNTTKKAGSSTLGTFTVPADFTATLYVVVKGSGSSGRYIQLKQSDVVKYTSEEFGSADPTVLKIDGVAAGTYTIANEGGLSNFYLYAAELNSYPLTSVALEEGFNLRLEQSRTPVFTITPAKAAVASQVWSVVSRTGASDANLNTSTGEITAGTEEGTLTVKVTVTDAFGNEVESGNCVVKIVNIIDQKDVTGSMTWNWTGAGTASVTIDNEEALVLGNYIDGDQWAYLKGTNGDQAYHHESSYGSYQGKGTLSFKTTVPGLVTITARRWSNTPDLKIGEDVILSLESSNKTSKAYFVPAGEVNIIADATDGMRILKIEFDAEPTVDKIEGSHFGGYTRTVNPQYYGTICLPKAGVMVGATVFEIAYMDYKEDGVTPYKVYYDQVENGTMAKGMPYIFLAEQSTIGVFYTSAVEETAQNHNGLYGTLENITSGMNGEGVFMLSNNKVLHSTNPASYLNANRAYIQISEIPGYNDPDYVAPAPKHRRISTGFNGANTATGVENIQSGAVQSAKVLINGKMYILRGEKMYDATGRLVK